MIAYLIKVTLLWCLLLLVYELLYRRSNAYTLNRLYLFAALAAGIFLPLVVWNLPYPSSGTPAGAIDNGILIAGNVVTPQAQQAVEATGPRFDVIRLLIGLYIGGVIVATLVSLREVILILRKAIYGQYQTLNGHRIFSSNGVHAPFSFMGWIFISHPEQYTEAELNYILKHEDAHNSRKHWLDMILMQLSFIIFWFHPLVWCFRYLLKLTHEFEADRIAADRNTYDYGHFLLQQTLLKGTPVIAHSFHFSPIKNRITMLTKMRKTNKWKFALTIPVLLGCTVLFAKSTASNERVRVGDKTTYRSHEFYWNKGAVDSIMVMDPVTKEATFVVVTKNETIARADKDSAFGKDDLTIQPQFRYENKDFAKYLDERLRSLVKNIPDSIAQIQVNNVVLDADGKIIYFDMLYINASTTQNSGMSFRNKTLDPIMEEILWNSPKWLPAMKDGKAVFTYMPGGGVISLKKVKTTHTFKGEAKNYKGSDGSEIIKSGDETITFPKQK